jgi:hypothetical protein
MNGLYINLIKHTMNYIVIRTKKHVLLRLKQRRKGKHAPLLIIQVQTFSLPLANHGIAHFSSSMK